MSESVTFSLYQKRQGLSGRSDYEIFWIGRNRDMDNKQIVETSLDIDFDVLLRKCVQRIVFLQRMGRCKRKRKIFSGRSKCYYI